MNEQTISLSIGQDGIIDEYWLNMEIKDDTPDDGMTVAEAADLIDAIYNIKPCEEQDKSEIWKQPDTGTDHDVWRDEDQAAPDDGTEDAQRRFAEQIVNSGAWDMNPDTDIQDIIAYNVTIKIFRSHRDEHYKLQVTSGFAGSAVRHTGRVVHTVDIDGTNSHTFNNPILYQVGYPSPKMAWQGFDGPPINITGNTAYWDGEIKGSLRAEFYTEWDEVTITVTGAGNDTSAILGTDQDTYGTGFFTGAESGEDIDDYQNIECIVIGFYHLQYQQLQLDRPEDDESTNDTDKDNIDRFITRVIDKEDDEPRSETDKCIENCPSVPNDEAKAKCYDIYDACVKTAAEQGGDPSGCVESLRSCLNNLNDQKDPKCVEKCNNPKCQQHINETVVCECEGKEEFSSYYEPIRCPAGVSDGSTLQGSQERRIYKDCGHTDSTNDPEFYEEKCCEPWPFFWKLMPKCKKIVVPYTGTDKEAFDRDDYPEGTNFIPVSATYTHCGEHTTEQIVHAEDCCDEISDLLWNYDSSAEVVGQGSKCTVYVTGGKLPITVKVRGSGFYLDARHTIRDATLETRIITLHTNDDACGTCQVYVTDGCSSVNGAVRCTVGAWELIGDSDICYARGEGVYTYLGGWYHSWDIIAGQYRTVLVLKKGDSNSGEDIITGIPEKDCDLCPSAFQESGGNSWRGGTCGIEEPDWWPCEYKPYPLNRLVCSYIYSKVSYKWVCP